MKWVWFMLVMVLVTLLSACSKQPTPYVWPLAAGFPKPEVPADNPMTLEKIELGRYLFYDRGFSGNGRQSCASCHHQANAFAEPRAVSVGSTGQVHRRNALALVNVAYNKTLTWAHPTLQQIEDQLLIPMLGDNPVELGIAGHEAQVLSRLQQGPYPALFDAAFGSDQASLDKATKALAAFVRSLISLNAPFDQYAYAGDDKALTAQQIKGMNLFFSERFECHHCHGGFNFTQSTSHEKQPLDRKPFHNTGLYYVKRPALTSELGYPQRDRGLAEVTADPNDDGRFRAPTLRNIALTAPYMHDGSVATLEEVLESYRRGGRLLTDGADAGDGALHPARSNFVKGIEMTDDEKQALLAFLQSLTDRSFITNPAFSDPWPAATP